MWGCQEQAVPRAGPQEKKILCNIPLKKTHTQNKKKSYLPTQNSPEKFVCYSLSVSLNFIYLKKKKTNLVIHQKSEFNFLFSFQTGELIPFRAACRSGELDVVPNCTKHTLKGLEKPFFSLHLPTLPSLWSVLGSAMMAWTATMASLILVCSSRSSSMCSRRRIWAASLITASGERAQRGKWDYPVFYPSFLAHRRDLWKF